MMRGLETIALMIAALGCAHSKALQGPPAPMPGDVSRVVVTAVNKDGPTTIVRDRSRIKAVAGSFAFSPSGWSGGDGRDMAVVYRIEFQGRSSSIYWLGVYPPAVSVPIYFYSTWWVSPSTRSGEIDRTRIKGLADTIKFGLFGNLGL
jgi:hypothetical protein